MFAYCNFIMLMMLLISGCKSTNFLVTEGASQEADITEDDEVDKPVIISSAFLFCAKQNLAKPQENYFGCRLEDQIQEKIDLKTITAKDLTAYDRNKKRLQISVADSQNNYWHWLIATGGAATGDIEIIPNIQYPGLSPAPVKVQQADPTRGLIADTHIMFYTAGNYRPGQDFSSPEDGNTICATEASSFFPGRQWKAVLYNIQEPDGYPIAINKPVVNSREASLTTRSGLDFWFGPMDNDILPPDPMNPELIPPVNVWTGIAGPGNQTFDCGGWLSTDPQVTSIIGHIDGFWLDTDELPCDAAAHLYCISL